MMMMYFCSSVGRQHWPIIGLVLWIFENENYVDFKWTRPRVNCELPQLIHLFLLNIPGSPEDNGLLSVTSFAADLI